MFHVFPSFFMACSDENQPHFKHFCKICKKGFMCGRALGGHMRAHGVDDEIWNLDDEEPSNDLESSLAWSQESEADDDEEEANIGVGVGSGWSKRKRTSRVCLSENEEDIALANCLMDLSNSGVDRPMEIQLVDQSGATNREEQRQKPLFSPVFLSSFTKPTPHLDKAKGVALSTTTPKGMFECKACKKVFNSHQALGGHRASHKNVKGCYASRNDQFDDNLADEDVTIHEDYKPTSTYQSGHGPSTGPGPVPLAGRKSKVHKCSICNRIFASGQALGGHKRCHWLTSNYTQDTSTPKFNLHEHIEQLHQRALAIPRAGLELNLTLPTSRAHDATITRPPTSLDVSTEINLHAWSTPYQEKSITNTNENNKHQSNNKNIDQDDHIGTSTTSLENVDGEDESKAKLAKLSELKDMNNTNGNSSSWLQVGIGSTTNIEPYP